MTTGSKYVLSIGEHINNDFIVWLFTGMMELDIQRVFPRLRWVVLFVRFDHVVTPAGYFLVLSGNAESRNPDFRSIVTPFVKSTRILIIF